MILKVIRWVPSLNLMVSRRHSSFTETGKNLRTGSPLTFSLIHMHAWGNTQPHTHMLDGALPAHPLSGTQQGGGHVPESEGASSSRFIAIHFRDIYQWNLGALLKICVCIWTVLVWQNKWNHNKEAFHDSLSPAMCPFMVHMLDLSWLLF